ncbi:MAG: hypothetical protein WDM96_08715 [Lacunisphaera sp.]
MNLLHTSFSRSLRLAPLALALFLAGSLRADETPAPAVPVETTEPDHFSLRLGAFAISNVDTRMSLTTASGQGGTLVDFANMLGGETSATIFRADADWYIAGPHRVEGSWYDINLTGSRVISQEIHFGDQTYPINAQIDSHFRTEIYKLSYGYTWWKGQKHELTGLIGAHIMSLDTGLVATNLGKAESFNVTAPLPAFGLGWTAHWTDRFETRAMIQYFGISLEEKKISGHFFDALFAAEYRLTHTFSVGAGYNRFDLHADVTRGPLTLNLTDAYNGFLVYLGAHF